PWPARGSDRGTAGSGRRRSYQRHTPTRAAGHRLGGSCGQVCLASGAQVGAAVPASAASIQVVTHAMLRAGTATWTEPGSLHAVTVVEPPATFLPIVSSSQLA